MIDTQKATVRSLENITKELHSISIELSKLNGHLQDVQTTLAEGLDREKLNAYNDELVINTKGEQND